MSGLLASETNVTGFPLRLRGSCKTKYSCSFLFVNKIAFNPKIHVVENLYIHGVNRSFVVAGFVNMAEGGLKGSRSAEGKTENLKLNASEGVFLTARIGGLCFGIY